MRYPERESGAPEQLVITRELKADREPVLPSPAGIAAPDRGRAIRGLALCCLALALGFVALKLSPAARIGPYGLVQALSPLYYVAVVILIASFALHLRVRWHRAPVLALHLAALVFLVHGAPAVIEGAARFETAYIHVGFTDYIADTGSLLQGYDARFSWPSFFEGMAMLDKVAGLGSAVTLLRWWPVAMNLLYLPFIFGIGRQLLRSELKAWVATGLFPLANWVGQDYFSPQSVAFLLYLALLFVLVVPLRANARPGWQVLLRRRDAGPPPAGPAGVAAPSGRAGPPAGTGFYLAAVVLLMAAIATGHQLTPFMAVVSALVLVVAGRTRVRGIVVVAALITVGWICYGAAAFWSGHIGLMIGSLGNVGGNVGSGVTQRVAGNADHERVVDIRLLEAALVWCLALLGALVGRPRNADRAALLLLFLAAFSMIVGGNYGGEGVLRVYLFSLPGAVCLIAALISRLPQFWHGQVALGAALLLLFPLFLFARWGNELYEMARPGELAATQDLYRTAPRGSSIITLDPFSAWEYDNPAVDITGFSSTSVALTTLGPRALPEITALAAQNPHGSYVVISADQLAYGWLAGGEPRDWGTVIEGYLRHSPDYALRYANADAEVFQYTPHPAGKTPAGTTTSGKTAGKAPAARARAGGKR